MAKDTGKKLADMMYGQNPEQAAFGFFPHMRPRRTRQDPEAAKNVPVDLARGFVAGTLGIPGDIESFARLPYELITGNESPTILPTSEQIEKRLPFGSDTPAGRAAAGLGALAGGFYIGPGSGARAVTAIPKAVKRAGLDFARAAGQPAVQVIKPKGGNWLKGSIERAIKPMKRADPGQMTEEQLLRGAWDEMRPLSEPEQSLNRWIDKKLRDYVRNEMATPEDPVRALAERGVLHYELPGMGTYNLDEIERAREAAGFPAEGMATTRMGREWETAADRALYPNEAGYLTRTKEVETNPWLLKVPPKTTVYEVGPRDAEFNQLGFPHLVDELRNMLNPESGLPRELRLTPEQLQKVTVPQAVERVAKINEWRAAQKAEADLARAQNAATQVFKEYPEQGFRWVELKQPEAEKITQLPEGWRVLEDSNAGQKYHYVVNEHGGTIPGSGFIGKTPEEAIDNTLKGLNARRETQALEDALKYEGETMGHCVGGYCPDVVEGRSKIYSLRDKKGQPHVTIEVSPRRPTVEQATKIAIEEGLPPKGMETFERVAQIMSDPAFSTQDIVQIKGKANRAPKEEYLPFVQDFVRSQKWGRVGDLENTGLIRIDPESDLAAAFSKINKPVPNYVTQDELTNLLKWNRGEGELPEGFAAGGRVHISDSPDVMQLELAGGGLVKGLKGAIQKAAKSAGMKEPVVAEKDLTTLQDVHTNLGDRVRAGAMEAQKMMEGFDYKYDKGQRVFTKDSASKNKPPYTILNRTRVGNQVMRADHPEFGPGMGKPIIDPNTGRAMRTPYEPGYRVRMERGPDDWAEFEIPESAIVGDVEFAKGGAVAALKSMLKGSAVRKAAGGEITADDLILEERKL